MLCNLSHSPKACCSCFPWIAAHRCLPGFFQCGNPIAARPRLSPIERVVGVTGRPSFVGSVIVIIGNVLQARDDAQDIVGRRRVHAPELIVSVLIRGQVRREQEVFVFNEILLRQPKSSSSSSIAPSKPTGIRNTTGQEKIGIHVEFPTWKKRLSQTLCLWSTDVTAANRLPPNQECIFVAEALGSRLASIRSWRCLGTNWIWEEEFIRSWHNDWCCPSETNQSREEKKGEEEDAYHPWQS